VVDLCIEYRKQIYVVEIKLIRDYNAAEEIAREGLEQIRAYRDRPGKSQPAYLVLFDRREEAKKTPWEEWLGWEKRDGVTVVRC
jgi:hypothetical protein